ncbi:DNA-binding MarR family transcriptional regulator [Olsenella profusa DSM 13989]|uniref:Sugar-specific transcriptional regulator, TrmB family n=1 Tax=Olsenella profusa F0195 TaxID=1125712 RepID=U2UXS0_9ACTN|nr:MarR family transcriptional regulator [Olsenella profusa]ERL07892.1 sugar-specific transcriptional regulator, TrmB family [Olsenella profusa F0195]MDP9859800.1 DNA-binding MarR family transcriptional regulator [Olsenella profusa DSM 13989]
MTDKFENFVGTISRASKAINRIKGQEMGQFGLKGTDSMCLYYLGKNNGGATSAELSRQIGVDRAAVSRMVTRLENSGFVKTVLSPQGKNYRSPIVLTKKGEAATERINSIVRVVVERAIDNIPEDERAAMYASLNGIIANLEKLANEYRART